MAAAGALPPLTLGLPSAASALPWGLASLRALLAQATDTQGQTRKLSTCRISSAPSSVQRPFSGLYTWVPLMMTVWAGRFTPQARVAVETKTYGSKARY